MDRSKMISQLEDPSEVFDFLVIGGGELLTKGAGIPQDELKSRIIHSTDKDLRYYMIQYIKEKGVLSPQPLNQWQMIPQDWTRPAAERDCKFLFGE